MKKGFRFYIALWVAKIATILLKALKRNASYAPGKIALLICPQFVGIIDKPPIIIGVTGTNGKTTVCNIIENILTDNNYKFIDNRMGSNVNSGLATTLITGVNLRGKTDKQVAVLEIDERSSPKIYPYLTPTYLICTNLFRDSVLRNAHTEFISNILTKYIPKKTKLILNGDDLITSYLAPQNERIYFGISELDTDTKKCNNIVKDIVVCPKCNGTLKYDFLRYNHIGKAHCVNCDFGSPKLDYEVIRIDLDNMKMIVKIDNKDEEEYNMITDNIINTYNTLAAITVLKEVGLTREEINSSLKNQKIVETRYSMETVNGIKIISYLAKGMNPIACSKAFDYVRKEKGNKVVILLLDDLHEKANSSENIVWYYDTDYEFLNDCTIKQIIVAGVRYLDNYVRLQIAGVPKEKIVHIENEIDVVKYLNIKDIDSVYILHDLYSIKVKNKVKTKVIKKIMEQKGD